MSTRRYTPKVRQTQVFERQQRVAAATAELHAQKGASATSYADIASRAGVSLPTVYSYFPTQADLMSACTGHVGAHAPQFPVQAILAAPDLTDAADRLIVALDGLHAYFEPWVSWRQEAVVPFLAELAATRRAQLTSMMAQILSQHRPGRQAACVAVWESILSFDLWQRLVRQHELPRARVRKILKNLLMAALGPGLSTSIQPGPRRKS